MDSTTNGLAEHACPAIAQKVWLPISMERYASKVIVTAKCKFCGQAAFEKALDKSYVPTKAQYIAV